MKHHKAGAASALGLIAGAVLGNIVAKKAGEFFPVISKYSGIIPAGVGFYLMGTKGATMKAAGAGMIAAGGSQIVGSFIPMASAPVSDAVLADAIIHEEINAAEMLEPSVIHEELTESPEGLTGYEDLTEDMN